MSATEFDPLDYDNLTRQVVEELLRREAVGFNAIEPFRGAGVYALFYTGNLPMYERIRSEDATCPIYVGKAVPPGGRKGLASGANSTALYKRLMDHMQSIETTVNLSFDDFLVRYLAVKPVWIVMAERFLIERYKPLWNSCIEGFGNHDPGSRRPGIRSHWDTLHPGRTGFWTAKVIDKHDVADLQAKIKSFLIAVEAGEMDDECVET